MVGGAEFKNLTLEIVFQVTQVVGFLLERGLRFRVRGLLERDLI